MLDNQAFNILYFQSNCCGPVVKRLRHRPFTAVSWVRIPSGSPNWNKAAPVILRRFRPKNRAKHPVFLFFLPFLDEN